MIRRCGTRRISTGGPTGTGKRNYAGLARVVDAPYVRPTLLLSATGLWDEMSDDVIHQLHEVDNEARPSAWSTSTRSTRYVLEDLSQAR